MDIGYVARPIETEQSHLMVIEMNAQTEAMFQRILSGWFPEGVPEIGRNYVLQCTGVTTTERSVKATFGLVPAEPRRH